MSPAPSPSLKQAARAEAQRDRILVAAQRCFIEHGFHAASMASIADAAGMSAGLIYRYFDSKQAIIFAIIDRQLADKRRNIAALSSTGDLLARINALFVGWQRGDPALTNPALLLEMSAQATRDQRIAAALGQVDRVSREDFSRWLQQRSAAAGVPLSAQDACRRAFALQCLIEGLAVRAVREPDLDPAAVDACLDLLLPVLLPMPAGG